MRWERLFSDLEARFDADADADLRAEVADRVRGEVGRTGLADRVAGGLGAAVWVGTRGGTAVTGVLRASGPDWLLVDEDSGAEALVALTAVTTVGGLPRAVGRPGGGGRVGARLGIAAGLRGIARDRVPVVVELVDSARLGGIVERVGRDHVELTEGDPAEGRRMPGRSAPVLLSIAAVAVVRRR